MLGVTWLTVLRDLRGTLNNTPIMPRDASLPDWKFFPNRNSVRTKKTFGRRKVFWGKLWTYLERYTHKNRFLFPFKLNEMCSGWQFSIRFYAKWNSIWLAFKKKNITTITFHWSYQRAEIRSVERCFACALEGRNE